MTAGRILRGRSKLAAICLTVSAVAAPIAFAQPASAAAGFNYCFRYSTGSPYRNAPVYLQVYTPQGWSIVAQANSDFNGCGSFRMGGYTNYYARVVARQDVRGYGGVVVTAWAGTTPLIANPGTAWPSLGTGIVYCYPITRSC